MQFYDDFNYTVSDEELSGGQGQLMTLGEHIGRVINVGDPEYKSAEIWYDGQIRTIDTHMVTVQFADVMDESQTIRDWFRLPHDLPYSRDAYLLGKSPKDKKHAFFHRAKFFGFLDKLGFWRDAGRFPKEVWNTDSWLNLDVAFVVQVQKPWKTPASDQMEGVVEAQKDRLEIKTWSYKLTAAGLRRQADRVRSVAPAPDLSEVPF
jgi:hypothetical protein